MVQRGRGTRLDHWPYLFGIVRCFILEVHHSLQKKSKEAKIIKFFLFSLDFNWVEQSRGAWHPCSTLPKRNKCPSGTKLSILTMTMTLGINELLDDHDSGYIWPSEWLWPWGLFRTPAHLFKNVFFIHFCYQNYVEFVITYWLLNTYAVKLIQFTGREPTRFSSSWWNWAKSQILVLWQLFRYAS